MSRPETEAAAETEADAASGPGPSGDSRPPSTSLRAVLEKLVDKVVLVVNPESYRKTPIGFSIEKETYRAKVKALHSDCLEVRCEFVTDPRKGTKEVTAQFIPVAQIKRVSVGQTDRYIHI